MVFFQAPPAQGDTLILHDLNQPTVIQGVDHYRMAIDVTPMADESCPFAWAQA
ncbi:MAG TPA: hypothetical protein IGR64_11820 [Leptolyngbyaceae cyanobacterium M65_K2018_010]|nr:hypothetical protein [Leptolyngbyaceae cyanobacterium M65_K2018_010]